MRHLRFLCSCTVAALGATSHADAAIDILVAERQASVLGYSAGGVFESVFASGSPLVNPADLAIGGDGDLYVANFNGGADVVRYNQNGSFVRSMLHLDLEEVVSVQVKNGLVYALANDTHRLGVFSEPTGAFLNIFGFGDLRFPHDMKFGPDGLLYVSNEPTTLPNGQLGKYIQVYDVATGSLVRSFGNTLQLGLPLGVDFGPDGMLYVADSNRTRIQRYNPSGALLGTFINNMPGQPNKIEFGPDGLLYVSYSANLGVYRYDGTTGAFVDQFIPLGGPLTDPGGLAILAVPEPTAAALMIAAGAVALRRRRVRP